MRSTHSIIDSSLTPDNAERKGYIYINDIPDLLQSVNALFLEAAKSGYKLGTAKKGSKKLGLYKMKNQ